METPDVPLSPTHIEETIRTITQLHAEHRQAATPFERGVDFVTALLGRPCFIAVLTGFIIFWVGGNLLPLWYPAFDPPPFSGLGSALSVVSVYLVILILIAQRRDDELALHREQLILELVISSEQKTAKIIQLLEEFRRDDPRLSNRIDQEAAHMARPADPSSVLKTIRDIHAGPEPTG
jgi:uncharacterized membrane protein